MINTGIVTKIDGNNVSVKLHKSSSCSHCSCCREERKMGSDFEFKINQKVEIGDLVTLEIAEKDVVKAALIAYIMPPIFMIAGYIIAASLGFSETKSIIGSFIGVIVSFVILGIYDRVFAKKTIDEEIKIISVGKYDPSACVDLSCGEHF